MSRRSGTRSREKRVTVQINGLFEVARETPGKRAG
jgi:hypothetical protein